MMDFVSHYGPKGKVVHTWSFGVWFFINVGCLLAIGVRLMNAAVGRVFGSGDLAKTILKYMYSAFFMSALIG